MCDRSYYSASVNYSINTTTMTRRSQSITSYEHDSSLTSNSSSSGEDDHPANKDKYRKMIHLKSEHKRRAQIHSGFQRVRMELPAQYSSKKMSKNEILTETIRYLEHLEGLAAPYMGTRI